MDKLHDEGMKQLIGDGITINCQPEHTRKGGREKLSKVALSTPVPTRFSVEAYRTGHECMEKLATCHLCLPVRRTLCQRHYAR